MRQYFVEQQKFLLFRADATNDCRIAKKNDSKIRIRQTLSHWHRSLSHRPKKPRKFDIRQSSHCSRDINVVELSVPPKFARFLKTKQRLTDKYNSILSDFLIIS